MRQRDESGDGEKNGDKPGVLWFDFASLCGGPRSQNDYLEIARLCHSVLLSGVPMMNRYQSAEARRFTWLVDVFYENRVKLIIAADCAAEKLYRKGLYANEFQRAVSRLSEMRSRDYLLHDRQQDACLSVQAGS